MEENTFKNLKQVAIYLRGMGYKISKTQIYEHGKARKIKPRDNGKYYLLDVEQYARECLRSDKAKPLNKIQQRRNEAEAAKSEAQAKHWQMKAKILEGSYVRKDDFERELAAHAMIFKYDLNNFAYNKAPEICHLVKGDNKLIPELIDYMLGQFADFLNRYAQNGKWEIKAQSETNEYEVIFHPAKDDPDNEDEENNAEFLENAPVNDI